MIRKKKLYTYVIAVLLVSLVWFVASLGFPVRSSRASKNDAGGFENIYPGENSFGVRNHAEYPTKRPTKETPLLSNEPTYDTDVFVSEDLVDNGVHVRDSVGNTEHEATRLSEQNERNPDINNRSPNTSARQANEKRSPASKERKTDSATSAKSAHDIHVTRASNVAPHGRNLIRGTTTVGYHNKSVQSRPKQLNGSAIRTTESTKTKHDVEAKQIAGVYENINLNEDNSRTFSKLSLPSKRTASGTRKKIVSYPTKVPTPRKDGDAMIRARAVDDAANLVQETNIARDNITTLTIPTSIIDKDPTGTIQNRSKQLISSATRIAESTPIQSEQSVKKQEAEQIPKLYETIIHNVDNSRAFSKVSLPSKRNAKGTSKKLMAYPTKVPRKDIDAIFRAKSVEDTANREEETTMVRDGITMTTLRVGLLSTLVDKDPNRSTQNRSKQLISPTKLEQLAKHRDVEAEQIAQVYENMNLNADNSQTFSKLSLPSKENANGTSKKLVEYPTKVPRTDIDAMFRARAVVDAANRERETNLARDSITITTTISVGDTDPKRLTQVRSKQLISSASRTTESTPTKLEQLAKQRDAEATQIARVYEKINLNVDHSRTFSKLSLPSKRIITSGTPTKLVVYPTEVHRKDIEALHEPSTLVDELQPNRTKDVGASDHLEGENVVSMSVYGSERRYTVGVVRNAEMIRENFPGWRLRVYTEVPSEKPRYGVLPQTVLDKLRALGTDIFFVDPWKETIPPMMWRFLVADDMSVDRFIIRDADSRLTDRDAAAVKAWVTSGAIFNCIRDHPSHAQYAVSGGMWGGKPAALRNVLRKSWREQMKGTGDHYLQDMTFLGQEIWPKVEAHAYCSDSVSCDVWPNAHPFPVPRYGYEIVGEVVDDREMGRVGDIQILRRAGENRKCSPKTGDLLQQ